MVAGTIEHATAGVGVMDRQPEAVRLYVGGHAARVQGEAQDLAGYRCFSAAHRPQRVAQDTAATVGLLDSGAFSDPPQRRLTPALALERQLEWEQRATRAWGAAWQAHAIVSYDRLIDETWTPAGRVKRRWLVGDAESAVEETVAAAAYLAEQRERLRPRTLVLACQGVDPIQYRMCVERVLEAAEPEDWIGLGGWCILGRCTRWLPAFWATLRAVLPLVRAAGVRHVHLFGVLWQRALGGLVWLADREGLTVSTDSSAPLLACTRPNPWKAGVRSAYWRDNVRWWQAALAGLRSSAWYREPPRVEAARQLALL